MARSVAESSETRDDAGEGAPTDALQPCTLRELALYFLRLGAVGFGGPIALAGRMQRDLVEERRWIGREDYLQGLALSQLAPGPLAAQLAMYLGWVRAGTLGALAVGVAFIAPSFLMVLVIAAFYVRYDGLAWMQGVFYGVGAAVIAIIALSTKKLAGMVLAKDPLHWALFVITALVTGWTGSEIVWLFLLAGVIAMIVKAPPRWSSRATMMLPPFLVSGLHGEASIGRVGEVGWFFTKAGAFVFGSGLAIVPFLYGGVVLQYHWLEERQFLDAVAVAMITPGPVVITSGFVGYLTAGALGAIAATAGTFVPPFLIVVLAARPMRRWSKNKSVTAFIGGVTAAAAGAIAGAAFILARRAIVDLPTLAIAVASGAALWRWRRIPEPAVIVVAAIGGLLLKRSQ